MGKRIDRDTRIVKIMIQKYCSNIHKSEFLCAECDDLLNYSVKHLVECPFEENKPVCSKCKIHCYSKSYKNKIIEVMQFAGPKMILEHPKDTVLYFFDKLRYRFRTVKINDTN